MVASLAEEDMQRAREQWGALPAEQLVREREQILVIIQFWQEKDPDKKVIMALEYNLLLVEWLMLTKM